MLKKKRAALGLTIAGVIITAAAALIPAWLDLAWVWRVVALVAAAVTIAAAVVVDRLGGATTHMVETDEWDLEIDEHGGQQYVHLIPYSTHARRQPQVTVHLPLPDGSLEEAVVGVSDLNGDIRLTTAVGSFSPMRLLVRIQ